MAHHLIAAHVADWIATWGYLGIFIFVFIGNLGVPMPEDTVLLAAGFLAGRQILELPAAFLVAVGSAVVADNFGYLLGRTGGRRLFTRFSRTRLARRRYRHLKRFFESHGGKTVMLARFVMGLRLMAGPMAGAAGMRFWRFFAWNVLGALVWCGAMLMAGYLLGDEWERVASLIHLAGPWALLGALLMGLAIYQFFLRERLHPATRL